MNILPNLKYLPLILSILFSSHISAGVADIKQSASSQPYENISKSSRADKPFYQASSAPAISWSPKLNLDNATGEPVLNLSRSMGKPSINLDDATGSPRIDISKATGQITSTQGVSNDIKDYIEQKLANVDGGSGGSSKPTPGWNTIYEGAGTITLNVPHTYSNWKATAFYKYNANKTGWNSKTVTLSGQWGAMVGVSESSTVQQQCSGGGPYISASASISSIAGPSMSWAQSDFGSKSVSASSYCNTAYTEIQLSNFVIKKFEVYYQ
ncbi:hypothetical protein [Vibrio sp.]|uniref:hypothetical protein n=1 Tax=Vibrio sp. TaxID=678 RepID=UPI003D102928